MADLATQPGNRVEAAGADQESRLNVPQYTPTSLGTEAPFFPNINRRATRPEPFPYRLENLLHLPGRLLRSPACAECNVETEYDCEKGSGSGKVQDTQLKVGQPRTLRKTSLNRVLLREVLENRFLPPLTRDEFTNYLRYEERTSENYFFFAWLEGYRKQYSDWVSEASRARAGAQATSTVPPIIVDSSNYDAYIASHGREAGKNQPIPSSNKTDPVETAPSRPPRPSEVPLHVRQSVDLALRTFFRSDSHLQLNLNEEVVRQVKLGAKSSLDPSIFDSAKEAVEQMLNDSLNKYLREVSGNAGRYRSAFAVFLGVFMILAAFAPFLLALWYHWHRALRLVCLPIIFFGTVTAIAGLRRTCIVIFFFGTARQLRMCELEKPLAPKVKKPSRRLFGLQPESPKMKRQDSDGETSRTAVSTNSMQADPADTEGSLSTKDTAKVDDHIIPTMPWLPQPVAIDFSNTSDLAGVDNILTLSPSPTYAGGDNGCPQSRAEEKLAGFSTPSVQNDELARSRAMTSGTGASATFVNPWDAASIVSSTISARTMRSSPIFAPLTRVLAPQIVLQQRESILRGAKYGVVVAILLGAIILGVPNISH